MVEASGSPLDYFKFLSKWEASSLSRVMMGEELAIHVERMKVSQMIQKGGRDNGLTKWSRIMGQH